MFYYCVLIVKPLLCATFYGKRIVVHSVFCDIFKEQQRIVGNVVLQDVTCCRLHTQRMPVIPITVPWSFSLFSS